MNYQITNYIESEDGKQKFYEGQTVFIGRKSGSGRTATITRISSKGIYYDVGCKNDKYIKISDVAKLSLLGE